MTGRFIKPCEVYRMSASAQSKPIRQIVHVIGDGCAALSLAARADEVPHHRLTLARPMGRRHGRIISGDFGKFLGWRGRQNLLVIDGLAGASQRLKVKLCWHRRNMPITPYIAAGGNLIALIWLVAMG